MCLVAQLTTFKQVWHCKLVSIVFRNNTPRILFIKSQNQSESFLPDETNKAKRRSCFIMFNNKVVTIIHCIEIMTYLDVN